MAMTKHTEARELADHLSGMERLAPLEAAVLDAAKEADPYADLFSREPQLGVDSWGHGFELAERGVR
jgi:hypothetical protein